MTIRKRMRQLLNLVAHGIDQLVIQINGGGVADEFVCMESISACHQNEVEKFHICRVAFRLSRQITEKRKMRSEYAARRIRLSKNEEANTKYGIGSRGSIRVGTGFGNHNDDDHY